MHSAIQNTRAAVLRGEFVVVEGDDRQGGQLVLAAQYATPARLTFLVRHSSGIVCVALDGERADRLRLPPMVSDVGPDRAVFTVSVDYRHSTTTGISAADRAATVVALADPATESADFNRPGHIFPVRARPGGLLERTGHAESAVDLMRLAGVRSAAVLSALVDDDGALTSAPHLRRFAAHHELAMVTIAELRRHRLRSTRLVERTATTPVTTAFGHFTGHVYRSLLDGAEHSALVRGDPTASDAAVRVHVDCGDVFGSLRCGCDDRLSEALAAVAARPDGIVVYLRSPQDRDLDLADQILTALGSRPPAVVSS